MKSIGKIDTQTLLLVGAAGVAVYMLTKRSSAQYAPQSYPNQYGQPQYQMSAAQLLANQQAAQGNSTAGIISSAGSAAGALLTGLSNLFG